MLQPRSQGSLLSLLILEPRPFWHTKTYRESWERGCLCSSLSMHVHSFHSHVIRKNPKLTVRSHFEAFLYMIIRGWRDTYNHTFLSEWEE